MINRELATQLWWIEVDADKRSYTADLDKAIEDFAENMSLKSLNQTTHFLADILREQRTGYPMASGLMDEIWTDVMAETALKLLPQLEDVYLAFAYIPGCVDMANFIEDTIRGI